SLTKRLFGLIPPAQPLLYAADADESPGDLMSRHRIRGVVLKHLLVKTQGVFEKLTPLLIHLGNVTQFLVADAREHSVDGGERAAAMFLRSLPLADGIVTLPSSFPRLPGNSRNPG